MLPQSIWKNQKKLTGKAGENSEIMLFHSSTVVRFSFTNRYSPDIRISFDMINKDFIYERNCRIIYSKKHY